MECQVKRFCSKRTLDVGRTLMKADPDSLGPEEYLWRQLKKRGILSLPKLNQDFQQKYSRLHVLPKYFRLRETVKALYLTLENDLQFIQRLRSFEDDGESFKYLRDKLRLEMDGTQMSLDLQYASRPIVTENIEDSEVQVIETKQEGICRGKTGAISDKIRKRRKVDDGIEVNIVQDNEENKDDLMEISVPNQMNQIVPQNVVIQRRIVRMPQRVQIRCPQESSLMTHMMTLFSKEYLIRAFKHLFTALILYHGLQYFISYDTSLPLVQGADSQSLDLIKRTLALSDSKRRLLPALLDAYSQRCMAAQNRNQSVVSWALMSAIAVKSHKIVSALCDVIQKFIRQLFGREGRQ